MSSTKERHIDIDRLHKLVVESPANCHGVGRTTAACYNCAAQILLADPGAVIIWYIPEIRWLDHIFPMLYDVCVEYDIAEFCVFDKPRALVTFTPNNVRVLFVTPSNASRRTRGVHIWGRVDDLGEAEEYSPCGDLWPEKYNCSRRGVE